MKPNWFAHPVLSLLVATSWLLLQQSLAVAHLLTAAVLALWVPRLVHGFLGAPVKTHGWRTVIRLGALVLYDIVVSNIAVAKIVLSPASRPRPAWVVVPLDLRHPTGITLLATIITTTPGTVSCVIDEARHEILVHALDCADAAEMAAQMKQRYERPLMEIFE